MKNILYRNRSCEDYKAGGYVCLWFESNTGIIASIVRDKKLSSLVNAYNVSLRLSCPEQDSVEIGFIGSDASKTEQQIEQYKASIKRYCKEAFNKEVAFETPIKLPKTNPKKFLKEFEKAVNLGKLKAYSKLSLERPLTDTEYEEMMRLAKQCGIKQ